MTKVRWPESKHNKKPSMALDMVPCPIDWKNLKRFYYFAGIVRGVAAMLLKEGTITHRVRWGGDWDSDTFFKDQTFHDLPHFELIQSS